MASCFMLIWQQMAERLLLHGGITKSEFLKISVGKLKTEDGVALLANSGM